MPTPTPDALRAALAAYPTPEAAYRALGTSRATVHSHYALTRVLREHRATLPARNGRGELGKHTIAVPLPVYVRLQGHGRRLSRVVRGWVADALKGPLPEPLPAGNGVALTLDLGATWKALGAAAGTTDPQRIAGVLRAILANAPIAPEIAEALREVAGEGEKD